MIQVRNTFEKTLTLPGVRALSARSVIASTLLGTHPPSLPARALVRMGELFGIADGTIRVALSRMVMTGELKQRDGTYSLTGRLLHRQARQDESRHPAVRNWQGDWSTAVVTGKSRSPAARAELRGSMAALRLAELREGVWLRPDNLDPERQPAARAVADAQCMWVSSNPRSVTDSALAGILWDLERWRSDAEELRAAMAETTSPLEAGDDASLAAAFLLSAAVLRHLVADPLLPGGLFSGDWPGTDLRTEYDAYDAAFLSALRDWSSRHAR